LVRSTESAAIHALRGIEEEAAKQRAAEIMVHLAGPVMMYLINHKRERIAAIEARYGMKILFGADPTLTGTQLRIDRLRAQVPRELPRELSRDDAGPVAMIAPPPLLDLPADDVAEEEDEVIAAGPAVEAQAATDPAAAEGDRPRRRRRRRRRGGRREDGSLIEAGSEDEAGEEAETEPGQEPLAAAAPEPEPIEGEPAPAIDAEATTETAEESARRRRSRRGGRRRRRDAPEDGTLPEVALPGSEQPELPVYAGPTPADPFGGRTFDIFDVMEQAEARAAQAALTPRAAPPAPPPIAAEPEPAPQPAVEAPAVEEPVVEVIEAPVVAEETAPEPAIAEATPAANGQGHDEPAEPASEPLIKPIVVGTAPVEAPKRGWWRR
jgi:ribonuclease E